MVQTRRNRVKIWATCPDCSDDVKQLLKFFDPDRQVPLCYKHFCLIPKSSRQKPWRRVCGHCEKGPKQMARRHPRFGPICRKCVGIVYGINKTIRRGVCHRCHSGPKKIHLHRQTGSFLCTRCRQKVNGIVRKKGKIRSCGICGSESAYILYRVAGVAKPVCLQCKRKSVGWKRRKTLCSICRRQRRCDYRRPGFPNEKVCWRCHRLKEVA